MPALLSSLIKAPAGDVAGAIAAGGDSSRACLREWLAPVPDHRSVMGRRHPLEFVLALAICAFTAAGHDSPAGAAEWAAGCSQHTLAVLGGRRDPWAKRIRAPSARTFARVFTELDAEAFNAAVYGWLGSLPAGPADALPGVTRREREQRRAGRARPDPAGLLRHAAADGKTVRGAVRPDGSQVHLLSVFDVATGCVRAQREIDAKTNEIPELAPAAAHLDKSGLCQPLASDTLTEDRLGNQERGGEGVGPQLAWSFCCARSKMSLSRWTPWSSSASRWPQFVGQREPLSAGDRYSSGASSGQSSAYAASTRSPRAPSQA